jgi:hypothetical protein
VGIAGLLRGAPRWAWVLGVLVTGGAFVAFILSRTTGLPSFKESGWEGLGLVSLVVEAAFCLIAAKALAGAGAPRPRQAATRRHPLAGRS